MFLLGNMPVIFCFISYRMELLFRQLPEIVFWTWHGVRQCFLFFVNIVFQTLKKEMEERQGLVHKLLPVVFRSTLQSNIIYILNTQP